MADTQDIHWVRQFADTAILVAQQEASVFYPLITNKQDVTGSVVFFDPIGTMTMRAKTTRNGLVTPESPAHSRRGATMLDYELPSAIDKLDLRKMKIDPKNPYVRTHAMAAGRQWDAMIYAAMLGNANSYSAALAASANALPTAQIVVNGSTGFTLAKLAAAGKILDAAYWPKWGRHFAYTTYQLWEGLQMTQIGSADYNTIKALAQGDIDTFAGFKFHQYEDLTTASSITQCVAWHELAVGMGIGQTLQTTVTQEALLGNSWLIYTDMSGGAVRIQDSGVVRVDCFEV